MVLTFVLCCPATRSVIAKTTMAASLTVGPTSSRSRPAVPAEVSIGGRPSTVAAAVRVPLATRSLSTRTAAIALPRVETESVALSRLLRGTPLAAPLPVSAGCGAGAVQLCDRGFKKQPSATRHAGLRGGAHPRGTAATTPCHTTTAALRHDVVHTTGSRPQVLPGSSPAAAGAIIPAIIPSTTSTKSHCKKRGVRFRGKTSRTAYPIQCSDGWRYVLTGGIRPYAPRQLPRTASSLCGYRRCYP